MPLNRDGHQTLSNRAALLSNQTSAHSLYTVFLEQSLFQRAGSKAKEPWAEENENKYTTGDWLEGDNNDLDQNIQKLQSEIAHLTETISHQNLGLSIILKTKEWHLKQIIQKYEELDSENPCIRKFPNPPPPQPLTLCMESPPENDFRHCNILRAIEQIVPKAFERKQVNKIQFKNMNVICGTAGHKNRWLITVSNLQIRNLLLNSGILIDGEHFALHRHDDIIVEDDKVHLRRALTKKVILDTLINSTDLSSIP
ncbi:putative uncharacterized protein C19orf81 homolog [Bufo gargarizans]|uniref:putative uncharacterized protein C19orf81 homolog n=1 Tax=Bufo gargarizans TaxID=30331 RepID=UPI001CF3C82D|nr:putative uncharacterized protein C19orf81 homolog [Bufo gargarizans]